MTLIPDWPTCLHDGGCEGVRWSTTHCLAHLDEPAQISALAALHPGSDIDLRGTPLTAGLLARLLDALAPDDENAVPRIGRARFDGARFGEEAAFVRANFTGGAHFARTQFIGETFFSNVKFDKPADFQHAEFNHLVMFNDVNFEEDAVFDRGQFSGDVAFREVRFGGRATFESAKFDCAAIFEKTRFAEDVWFTGAQFEDDVRFSDTRFSENAWYDDARFKKPVAGRLVCRGTISAKRIVAERTVRLRAVAEAIDLTGASFASPCVLAIRFAKVDLTDVETAAPLTVTTAATLPLAEDPTMRPAVSSKDPRAKVLSLAGTDASNIVLADVDLSGCVFSGAHHLDEIRLEGRCLFAAAPRGWHAGRSLIPLRRWTRRKVLAEEVAWRRSTRQRGAKLPRASWESQADRRSSLEPASPAQLAVLYRQLRKALEDRKDAPGAADFYYGEMEARRHDKEGTPRGERGLLWAYWLLSGYALRASRALAFLAVTAGVTFLLMMTLGLPDNQPNPRITGAIPAPGGRIALAESTPDPTLTLPFEKRFTAARADQAALVVVDSVIFRSTGAALTGPGTWIEIISRIGEPVLLGFAAVAARGRVQR